MSGVLNPKFYFTNVERKGDEKLPKIQSYLPRLRNRTRKLCGRESKNEKAENKNGCKIDPAAISSYRILFYSALKSNHNFIG